MNSSSHDPLSTIPLGLAEARRSVGLPTPHLPAKQLIFSRVHSETANIALGYDPNPTAQRVHGSDARAVGLSGGWGAGKSLCAAMEALTWIPYSNLIWILALGYRLARPEFLYLAEAAVSTGLARPSDVRMPGDRDKPCSVTCIPHAGPSGPERCVVETLTVTDFGKIAGRRPDLILICEPGGIDDLERLVQLAWGRLAERRGRLLVAGTSDEASQQWREIWDAWSQRDPHEAEAFSMPTWDNRWRYPQGRDDPEFTTYEKRYGTQALMAHFGGVPAPPAGLVLAGYHSDAIYDDTVTFRPDLPTEIAIDPNYSDGYYSVALIQWDDSSGAIYVPDAVAEKGRTHQEMYDIVSAKPWWPFVSGGVIDPYAGESHIYGAPPAIDYWQPLTLRYQMRPRVRTTVQALKEVMLPPGRLRVNPSVERFRYEALRWKLERSGEPSKRNCDMLKAVGYWLVDKLNRERRLAAEHDNIVVLSDWGFAERWG